MANSVDPDQTVPIGAVCSGSILFASILNLSVMLGKLFAADDFSRRHFQMHFFLGALRVNILKPWLNGADLNQIRVITVYHPEKCFWNKSLIIKIYS